MHVETTNALTAPSLKQVAEACAHCRNCPLDQRATQAVLHAPTPQRRQEMRELLIADL